MHLSKRLQAVADMVPKNGRTADIGCDHAYVSLYLVQNHIAEKVIAMDVNKGPLQKAKENVEKYGCSDMIDLRLSDGAEKLAPKEADVLLIAGMGGGLVQKILSERREVVKECKALILQPQSEIVNVRKYVMGIGFQIVEEKILIDEGKFYMMFRAENNKAKELEAKETKGKEAEIIETKTAKAETAKTTEWTETEYKYGKLLLESKDSCLHEFLNKEKKKYEQILAQLEQSDRDKNKVQYEKMKQEYEYCKEGLKYYEM